MGGYVRCGVLVVGGGNAALCAAITARERGADVLLLERAEQAWRGGNSKYTRNIRCVRLRNESANSYTEEEFAADLREVTGDGSDRELTEMVIAESALLPSWMESHGIRWQQPLNGTLSLGRTNRFFLGGGKALINVYYAKAQELGVKVLYGYCAEEFAFAGSRCVRVIARGRGEVLEIAPDAVVVASAGFEANHDWLREYWGDGADNIMVRGARQNDGLVLRRLLDGGAAVCGDPRAFHAIAVDARGPRFEGGIVTRVDSVPLSIMVNSDAQRFYDEGENLWPKRYAIWGSLIIEQPDQIAYSIFDRKVLGRFMTTAIPPYEAQSLDGIARQTGLDTSALRETVDTYNASVIEGAFDPQHLDDCRTDGLPCPKSHWALTIDEPPYYAYPLRPGITFTYLGLRVNREARVMRAGAGAFANVFAAGEIVAGNVLVRGYLAGVGMTIGTVFGRLAGQGAADVT
jgi:tricarballylate dehydrogenase